MDKPGVAEVEALGEYYDEEFEAYEEEFFEEWHGEDPYVVRAEEALRAHFEKHNRKVFYSRQLEVLFERDFFHWITNAALHRLEASGFIKAERRALASGEAYLVWHRSYRYYKRDAVRVVRLIEEYSDPVVTETIGDYLEALVLEGFARHQFVMLGRHTSDFGGKRWVRTGHKLDFIFGCWVSRNSPT